ncbi:MAG: type I glyceraldehyde-3-phosphate dehydrogenase [Acidobacteria bacterium]|nr:MAG: type I glyceraldehyde-3-phosphate dehydrogenase [Acidobacteriota bacterium]
MSIRFAINGLGRIGRALVRVAAGRPDLELVAVNDLGTAEQLALLLERDSLHGRFAKDVAVDDGDLWLDGRRVATHREPEAEKIPWEASEPQIVLDSTGWCITPERARVHHRGSVKKVLVSGNAKGMDITVCQGVNDEQYDPASHHLLSAASCTTNCLAPVALVLDRTFTINRALLNTVHSYNNDQRLLSYPHRDPRRARSAAINIIPTTTSAIQAVCRILPELTGKIEGFAVRVPTPLVSLIDLVVELDRRPTDTEINDAFRQAATGDLEGILTVSEDELVSSDFLGDPHSAIVDLPLTQTVENRLCRVVAWYDNEWGHASRLADLLELAGRSL